MGDREEGVHTFLLSFRCLGPPSTYVPLTLFRPSSLSLAPKGPPCNWSLKIKIGLNPKPLPCLFYSRCSHGPLLLTG